MNSTLKFLILFFSCFSTYSVYAQDSVAQKTLTLSESIQIAMQNNSQIAREHIGVKRSEADLKQSKWNLLPSVSAHIGHGLNQGRSVDPTTNQFIESSFNSGNQGISADMNLFNGFRSFYDIRMKAYAYEASTYSYTSFVNQFKLQVIEGYVQVLTAQDLVKQAEVQFEVTQEHFKIAETRFNEGDFSPGDYYDIKAQLKNDENALENSYNYLLKARYKLATLMEIDYSELGELAQIQVSPEVEIRDEQSLFEAAQNLFPSFRAIDYKIAEAKNGIGSARAAWYPNLSLSAGLNSRYSSYSPSDYFNQFNQNLGKYVSVNLSIPIFNKMQTSRNVQYAKMNLRDLQLYKKAQKAQLAEETALAVFDLKRIAEEIKNLKEQKRYVEESFRIASTQFEVGLIHSYTLLLAKNKMEQVRQNLLMKEYEFLYQLSVNDYYQGKIRY